MHTESQRLLMSYGPNTGLTGFIVSSHRRFHKSISNLVFSLLKVQIWHSLALPHGTHLSDEVFTVPPHSRWIPGGIHVISMWIPSIPYGIVWLRAQPFWRMIPYSFHMETPWNLNIPWNISLESRWNEHGIHHNSFHGFHIIPDGFHIIPDGFHNISHGFHIIPYGFHIIPHYSTWTPHYFRWIPYYFIFIPYYFTWIPYYSRWIPCRWPNNM